MKIKFFIAMTFIFFTQLVSVNLWGQALSQMKEQYRPQIHFSPMQHWINDPNGMVYYNGIYHLFFQLYKKIDIALPPKFNACL